MQIVAVALENFVLSNAEENIEVAGRAAADADLALVRKADAGAFFDAGRDGDRQCFVFAYTAGAGAGAARIFDDFAHALTTMAGALDGEKSLRGADAAGALAGGAGGGFRAFFAALAMA